MKLRSATCILAVLLLLLAQMVLAQTNFVRWSQFQAGQQSKIQGLTTRVLMTEGDWQSFWRNLTGQDPSTAPKGIKWNEELLIAVCIGQRKTGGYSVRIEDMIKKDAGNVIVQYSITSPRSGDMTTQAITSPWVVARVSRQPVDYSFSQVEPRGTGQFPQITPPIWGGGYDRYPVPLPWTWCYSGTMRLAPRRSSGCLATPDECDLYFRDIIERDTPSELLRGIRWSDEVLIFLHGELSPAGTTIGIDSVLLDQNGRILVTWYLKAPISRQSGSMVSPYMILKLPRYSTAPMFRRLPGDPR